MTDHPTSGPSRRLPAVVLLLVALVWLGPSAASESRDVPGRLSDGEFWRMVTEFSEAGGTFPSENFVSNESEFQTVIPDLTTRVKPGGVYLGVGPDQNFTYIAAARPAVAFIVDIRRQNLLHHLLYKAIMEMSPTRADFLTRLFGRPKPKDIPDNAPAGVLFAAYLASAEIEGAYEKNFRDVTTHLTGQHGFALTLGDQRTIGRLLQVFHTVGPDLAYASSFTGPPRFDGSVVRLSFFPAFADLMVQTDRQGTNHAYLADEARYRIVREMQLRNLIVPVVGDFAGPKALRAVGAYVRARKSRVTTIYTSNVEQYLFQNGVWEDYYASVGSMPLDETSTFIRAYFPSSQTGGFFIVRPTDPPQYFGARPGSGFIESSSLLSSVRDLLDAVAAGQIQRYLDVVGFSQ